MIKNDVKCLGSDHLLRVDELLFVMLDAGRVYCWTIVILNDSLNEWEVSMVIWSKSMNPADSVNELALLSRFRYDAHMPASNNCNSQQQAAQLLHFPALKRQNTKQSQDQGFGTPLLSTSSLTLTIITMIQGCRCRSNEPSITINHY